MKNDTLFALTSYVKHGKAVVTSVYIMKQKKLFYNRDITNGHREAASSQTVINHLWLAHVMDNPMYYFLGLPALCEKGRDN